MEGFKTALITYTGAFLIGAASAAPGLALGAKVTNSDSDLKYSNARVSGVASSPVPIDSAHGDPETPTGYSPLGITQINGKRIAVYVFQNGAKVDDVAGEGQGFADVFDSAGHLIRRFTYRENLNSPAQITEFVFMPAR
jgi:hypothetical protein